MPLVITEQHGGVRHVVLNRAEKRNAFNGELVGAVGEALRRPPTTTTSRCVVLRGAGPMFSSGMDLASLASSRPTRRTCARSAAPSSTPGTWPRR